MESTQSSLTIFDRRRAALNTPVAKALRILESMIAALPFSIFGALGIVIGIGAFLFFYKLSGL